MKFEDFYEKYKKSVFLYAWKRTGSKEAAEDVTSDTFVKLYVLWDDLYKENDKQLLSWVYTTTRNRIIDISRKNSKLTGMEYEMVDEDDVYSQIIEDLDMKEDMQKVAVAISSLDRDKQEILELRFKEGYKIKEIAEIVGKKEGAVKMMIYRSLEKIRNQVQEEDIKS